MPSPRLPIIVLCQPGSRSALSGCLVFVFIIAAIARDYPLSDRSTSTAPLAVTLARHTLDIPCSWVPEGADAGFERVIMPDRESVAGSPWAEEGFERIRHQGTHERGGG